MPVGGLTMMNLFVPLSVTECGAAPQFESFSPEFCCSVKSVNGEGCQIF